MALARLSSLLRASGSASGIRAFATQAAAAPQQPQKYDSYSVPAGHQNSDLDSVACNISLNRRRDLTLRQDLYVFENGKKATIADVMKVRAIMHVQQKHGMHGGAQLRSDDMIAPLSFHKHRRCSPGLPCSRY